MKKLILIIAIALVGFTTNAQNFNLGVSGGLPVGDASDAFSFSAVLDASALWEVSEEFYAGVATGFIYSFGDSIDTGFGSVDFDDFGFLPVAAAGRYALSEEFVLGADIGYALGITPSEADGGFYYAPRLDICLPKMLVL